MGWFTNNNEKTTNKWGFATNGNTNNNGSVRQTKMTSWGWLMSYDDKIKKKEEYEQRYCGKKFVVKSDGLYKYD